MADPLSKLKETILYVARRCAGMELFGRTKLNKILFNADFASYAQRGASITGAAYVRQEHGPVPATVRSAVGQLIREGRLAEQKLTKFGRTEHRAVVLRDPNLGVLSSMDISILEDVIREAEHASAAQMSEESHRFIGWEVFAPGETIPYESVYYAPAPLTPADEQYARSLRGTFS